MMTKLWLYGNLMAVQKPILLHLKSSKKTDDFFFDRAKVKVH